jgi:hypothetical protein
MQAKPVGKLASHRLEGKLLENANFWDGKWLINKTNVL